MLVVEALAPAWSDMEAPRFSQALGAEMLAAFTFSEILRVLTAPAIPEPGWYRLSGTLLRAGETLLASLVLDEAITGRVIWAEQVTLPAAPPRNDAFLSLLAKIEVHIMAEALERARQSPPEELQPADLVMLGRAFHHRGGEANTREAQKCFLRAIAMMPDLAIAHGYHAHTVIRFMTHGWGEQDWAPQRALALDIARRGVELAPRSPLCLSALAFALLHDEQWDDAVETARMALRLSSLAAMSTRTACAEVLASAGEAEEAAAGLQEVVALDPFCPPRSRAVLGRALLLAGRTEEALTELHRSAARLPDYAPCLRSIVVAAVELGRMDEARRVFAQLRRMQPNWVSANREVLAFFRRKRDTDRFIAAFAACESSSAPDASPRP